MEHWIFQANPKLYDVDTALATLDRLSWRVPQYTREVHIGDVAAIWRSGKNAGIVGLGRVVAEPRLRRTDTDEKPFVLALEEAPNVPRVLVSVKAVPFVPKERVRAIAGLQRHRVVVAPMGTVFPVSKDEWTALRELLPEPPSLAAAENSALPTSLG